MMGLFENITINFILTENTKFICDLYFGKIKKTFRDQIVNTIDDIEKIINNSTKSNIGLKYNDRLGWEWYDFENFLLQNFKNCPHLKSYYHFRFSNLSEDLGKVYCSKKSDRNEICYTLLSNDKFNAYKSLNTLEVTPLSIERQKYLYTKIRQYVDEPYKDIYCLKSNL